MIRLSEKYCRTGFRKLFRNIADEKSKGFDIPEWLKGNEDVVRYFVGSTLSQNWGRAEFNGFMAFLLEKHANGTLKSFPKLNEYERLLGEYRPLFRERSTQENESKAEFAAKWWKSLSPQQKEERMKALESGDRGDFFRMRKMKNPEAWNDPMSTPLLRSELVAANDIKRKYIAAKQNLTDS